MRISLTGDPIEEVKVGKDILRSLNLLNDKIKIVSCPTCGRCNIDLINIANEVENKIQDLDKNMTVAIMGCVVKDVYKRQMIVMGIIGSIIAQIGDLFASSIKRYVGIKDYGNLIPGHGGVLDRFDSVILVAPFVYSAVIFFMK